MQNMTSFINDFDYFSKQMDLHNKDTNYKNIVPSAVYIVLIHLKKMDLKCKRSLYLKQFWML